ncbi:hypothetical protein HZB58_04615 [Candidatus Gottesmanbacteria bacterium]|nr:hypothetical protein [Candidatus Gottesmanbacteria bacterium]
MAVFGRELLTPFLRGVQPSLRRTPQEAVDEYWSAYGNGINSYGDWLNARESFRAQTGNIPVPIRGGGRAAMWTAEKILKSVPNAHIVLYDDEAVLGGMARRAISSFIPGHVPAKTGAFRDAMKLVTSPRLDIIPNTSISESALVGMAAAHRLPVVIDAPGAVPARGAYPYGERVWDIMDLVKNINRPFDEDGHMGRVQVPVSRSSNGRRLPKISVIGGNTGRDAQVAFSLVDTVRDIAELFGVPVEEINEAKILEHGITKTRSELGLSPLGDRYIYRRSIGEMSGVKKLFPKTAKLERGNPELAAILENGILGVNGWQEKEGGQFLGNTELEFVEDDGAKLRARLRNNVSHTTEDVDASLALISTGFTPGTPFRVTAGEGETMSVDVGMKVSGGGDLVSTMESVKTVVPAVIERLSAVGGAYPDSVYRTWLTALGEAQHNAGVVGEGGTPKDPIAFMIEHGPRHMTDRVFIGFAEQDSTSQSLPVRIQVDEHV